MMQRGSKRHGDEQKVQRQRYSQAVERPGSNR
jgi:hypothetical protein